MFYYAQDIECVNVFSAFFQGVCKCTHLLHTFLYVIIRKNRKEQNEMLCKFSDVTERDMDLLFLEELACSKSFLKIFLNKIHIDNADVIEIEHSKTDIEFGESDITLIIQSENKRIALLIEDKIDAIAMPNQYSRYIIRGKFGIKNGDYSEYYVFIIAPQKYLSENSEAKKYPYQVSYEECIEYFENINADSRSDFKLQQIKSAINKQKTGYQVIESEHATAFWERYIEYQKNHYPQLCITNGNGKKGARMKWVYYSVPIADIHLIHKIDSGFVDLEFSGYGEKITELTNYITSILGNISEYGLGVFRTGKSAVLRFQVPKIDFDTDFEKEEDKINFCLQGVCKLNDVAYKLSEHDNRMSENEIRRRLRERQSEYFMFEDD